MYEDTLFLGELLQPEIHPTLPDYEPNFISGFSLKESADWVKDMFGSYVNLRAVDAGQPAPYNSGAVTASPASYTQGNTTNIFLFAGLAILAVVVLKKVL